MIPTRHAPEPQVRCLSCGGWGWAWFEWPDGLTHVGVRCENCARTIAEHRAALAGASFTPRPDLTMPPAPPSGQLVALPAITRRTL